MRALVLVPSEDRADRAVHLAADLASRAPLSVSLLRVLEESFNPLEAAPSDEAARMRDLLVEAETRTLERMAEPLRDVAESVDARVCWGVPWDVVLEQVVRESVDLVIKPARGLSHEGRVFFGVTALHLFRKCPCPVWVVGNEGRLPNRILAAVDPADDPDRRKVAGRIVEWSQWIADRCGARLEVASCWDAPSADLLEETLASKVIDEYVDRARSRAEAGLQAVLEASASTLADDCVHVLRGDARDVLPRFAEGEDFDLVVMGSLGRTGVAGEELGQTAELVVRGVRSSVMTISPRSRPVG